MLVQLERHLRRQNLEGLRKAAWVEPANNVLFPQGVARDRDDTRLRVGYLAETIPDAHVRRRPRSGGATEAHSTRIPFLPCSFDGFLYALHHILIIPDGYSETLAMAGT